LVQNKNEWGLEHAKNDEASIGSGKDFRVENI
jgi:hypothetical protein